MDLIGRISDLFYNKIKTHDPVEIKNINGAFTPLKNKLNAYFTGYQPHQFWDWRIVNYCRETGYPQDIFVGESGRLSGVFDMGANFRVGSGFFGGYPAGYLKRIRALFPEFGKEETLHLFSGHLFSDKSDFNKFPGVTVDINPDHKPDFLDDAQELESVPLGRFRIVLADPPYSEEDAEHYGVPLVKRNKVMKVLGEGLHSGTIIVWLDQVLPMYKKTQFIKIGQILMSKSTNHRFRGITIFMKI